MDELKINELLSDIEQVLFGVLRSIDLDNSNLARETTIRFDGRSIVIDLPDYAINIDRGRSIGADPVPLQAILEFIVERGINPRNISREDLAYAIINSIQRRGIRPRPFLDRLHQEIAILVGQHINMEVNRSLSETFNN